MTKFWTMLRGGFEGFIDDEAFTRGAAIAFYAVTALAPILFITVAISGLVFGDAAARGAVAWQLHRLMSKQSAEVLQLAIRHASSFSDNILANIFGIATLLFTASGVFGEMESALNHIWGTPAQRPLLSRLLRGRIASLALVISLGFLFLLSMIVTAGLTALHAIIDRQVFLGHIFFTTMNFAISFALISLLFAAIYKVLPEKDLLWRDVILGAMLTSFLFEVGQIVLGVYLGSSAIASPYGAAGGLIVLLLWVYYSAQVFLLGAEFNKAYATHYGSQQ
ncbi:MAG TPA: YihY/virulence factor BrkB family protein [Rhizomicrobium sp.]|nr:YihY/virulence factor BrkB family protein [Rhizomicrobium sp.]